MEESSSPQPKAVAELTVVAFDDGSVSLTVPQAFNVWVLRGVLAKALEMATAVAAQPTAEELKVE